MSRRAAGIALVGFMGAGKTTVGSAVAQALGWPFLDLDDLLVARHGPIAAQFSESGEVTFRERERACVVSVCDGERRVLSTGGGTWSDPRNRAALGAAYRTFFLDVTLPVATGRIGDGAGRPNVALLPGLYGARRPEYALADVRVDADRPVAEIVQDVVHRWTQGTLSDTLGTDET